MPQHAQPAGSATMFDDRAAIARYDYLMQTADPRQVELMHRDAFAWLSPVQRAQVEARMRAELAGADQPASASVADLARAASRAESMRPGRMSGLLARVGGGSGGVLGVVASGAIAGPTAVGLLDQAFGIDFDVVAATIDLGSIARGALQ